MVTHQDNFKLLYLNTDWLKDKPELPLGSIQRVLDVTYHHDKMCWGVVLERIGEPVKEADLIEITYR